MIKKNLWFVLVICGRTNQRKREEKRKNFFATSLCYERSEMLAHFISQLSHKTLVVGFQVSHIDKICYTWDKIKRCQFVQSGYELRQNKPCDCCDGCVRSKQETKGVWHKITICIRLARDKYDVACVRVGYIREQNHVRVVFDGLWTKKGGD